MSQWIYPGTSNYYVTHVREGRPHLRVCVCDFVYIFMLASIIPPSTLANKTSLPQETPISVGRRRRDMTHHLSHEYRKERENEEQDEERSQEGKEKKKKGRGKKKHILNMGMERETTDI